MLLNKKIVEGICFGNAFGTINNIYTTLTANIAVTFTFFFFLAVCLFICFLKPVPLPNLV